MNMLLIVVLCIALLFMGIWIAKMKPKAHYRAKLVMTDNEQEFFWRLTRALPDHYIFPQVSMAALLESTAVSKKRKYADFGRISQKRIDYAIYDKCLKLVCICELDDRTHNAAQDAIRDGYFASAGIKTIRWQSRNKPEIGEISHTIKTI